MGFEEVTNEFPDNNTGNLTMDEVKEQTVKVFEATMVLDIASLLDGTSVHSILAPGLIKLIDEDTLPERVTVNKDTFYITGLLTEEENRVLINLDPTSTSWAEKIDKLNQDAIILVDVNLAPMPVADIREELLAGDSSTTPLNKMKAFLRAFIPFLRAQEYNQLHVSTVSAIFTGLDQDTISWLLRSRFTSLNKPAEKYFDGYVVPPKQIFMCSNLRMTLILKQYFKTKISPRELNFR
jgi:hypothetical protein